MAQNVSDEIAEYKQLISGLFDRAAPTYDQVGPRFFAHFGHRLVELAKIRPKSHILDVATGRGASLFPAADAAGPDGYAVGIDFSNSMVEETSAEIQQLGLQNVKVSLMDAENLQFPDASFDYVLCNLSVFIFPQHDRALSEMRRVLKPGGTIGLSTFWHDDERWKWLGDLFSKYLPQPKKEEPSSEETSLEKEEPPGPDFRSHEGMEAVMNVAGFTNIHIHGEEPDFVYTNEEDWWSTVWSHGMRGTLERIERTAGVDALKRFKADAFDALQSVRQTDGFHQMWSVLYTLATKPEV